MKNKSFIVSWSHNYGLGAGIINAKDLEQATKIAKRLAKKYRIIWLETMHIIEINTEQEFILIEE